MNRYSNKKILVTGGASGIGKAICERLITEGADLAFIDRNSEAGKELEQELGKNVASIRFFQAELTNENQVEKAFQESKQFLNRIDILINNAGGAYGENYEETTVENWNADLALNLTSHYMLTRLVLPGMVEQGYGAITNISSVNGIQALGNPAYSAAKAGVIALTKSLGKELSDKNIAVNCVTPAAAKTRIFDQMTKKHIDYMLSKIPRNRFAKVEELASLVAWLASEENSFSTGAVFDLSGGRATY